MTAFKIDVTDASALDAFNRLLATGRNLDPALRAIGAAFDVMTKESFAASRSPDGVAWAPNSPVTLARFAASFKGKANFKKDGSLSAKGERRLAAKKPLIGETHVLSGPSIGYNVTNGVLDHGSSVIQAAILQRGGKVSDFPHLWGDIPARPFEPVTADNQLMAPARVVVDDAIQEALIGAWQR